MLTWYGPSLLPARDYLEQILHREATGSGNRH
jgi:hypothetical protein